MKNVYISLPISGRDMKEVIEEAQSAQMDLMRRGYNAIHPMDVCPDADKQYSYYMGRDIEALLNCDAIFFCPGWEKSKGCSAEFAIAKIYGLEIIGSNDKDEKYLAKGKI